MFLIIQKVDPNVSSMITPP